MNQQERNRRISEGLRLAWKRRKGEAMKFGVDDKSEQRGELVGRMGIAREIAARVWCDQEMGSTAMDVDAAEEIATIIERVRRVQAIVHPSKYQENHGKYQARDLTPEEAQAVGVAAPPIPLSDERIQKIVTAATASPGPRRTKRPGSSTRAFSQGPRSTRSRSGIPA